MPIIALVPLRKLGKRQVRELLGQKASASKEPNKEVVQVSKAEEKQIQIKKRSRAKKLASKKAKVTFRKMNKAAKEGMIPPKK